MQSSQRGRVEWSLAGVPLPIVLRPLSPWSDEDLLAFSRNNTPLQMERSAQGELSIMTPVGGDGGIWEGFVIRELGYWAEDNGGPVFSSNAGFRLPDGSILSPDASWVSDQVWSALSPDQRRGFPPVCPEFLIEILSENDSPRKLREKMQAWIQNGCALAWMIDPFAATITIYSAKASPELLSRPDSVEAGEPVAGFRLTTAKRWP